jgi:hypothetical protein
MDLRVRLIEPQYEVLYAAQALEDMLNDIFILDNIDLYFGHLRQKRSWN